MYQQMLRERHYSKTLEADLKTWLSSRDDDFFFTHVYMPLHNYIAGLMSLPTSWPDREDTISQMVTDIVLVLPKYDASKGCTIMSFIRLHTRWIMGARLDHLIRREKTFKTISYYKADGEIDDELINHYVVEADDSLDEWYASRVEQLIEIMKLPYAKSFANMQLRQEFERQLLSVLTTKGTGKFHDRKKTLGLCGWKPDIEIRHKNFVYELMKALREKVKHEQS